MVEMEVKALRLELEVNKCKYFKKSLTFLDLTITCFESLMYLVKVF